jgi:hypothetical protein
LVVRIILSEERRLSDTRPPIPVTGTLGVPGNVLLALPPVPENWMDPERQLRFELRDGDRVVLQESPLPKGASVTVQNRRCLLTATPLGSQVRVELVEEKPAQSASAQ